MPTNTSRFFNTAGLVRKSFRTQNLLQKKMILAFSIVLEGKTTHKKKIVEHPNAMCELLLEGFSGCCTNWKLGGYLSTNTSLGAIVQNPHKSCLMGIDGGEEKHPAFTQIEYLNYSISL